MPLPSAPTRIHHLGLVAKPRSELAARLVPELLRWLHDRSITVAMDQECAAYAGQSGVTREELAATCQMLVVLGGDGTLLSTARAAIGREIPVFAVNLGGLGFLTGIKIEDIYARLETALAGEYQIARRRMLHTEVWRHDRRVAQWESLNDSVLTKTDIARMIQLEVYVDDHFVCVYRADGLIVSTPTGSTAYSLSAGGPILYPTVAALLITPICPHMLTNRPVIVPDDSVIQVVAGDVPSTYLTIDGQVGETLLPGDRVMCRRSDFFLSLVAPPNMAFFDVLREKLKWGGR